MPLDLTLCVLNKEISLTSGLHTHLVWAAVAVLAGFLSPANGQIRGKSVLHFILVSCLSPPLSLNTQLCM